MGRAPGAPTLEELRDAPKKVHYLKGIYERMHRFMDETRNTILGQFQRNEYARYSLQIRQRRGRVFVLTGTATMFRAEAPEGDLLPTGSLRLADRGQVSTLPGYASGGWWVQDAAAALAVPLLGDVKGQRVLDMCAAPGGKTMQLAAAGADVTALDISGPRMARVAENLARTGLAATCITADALDWQPDQPFDAILLDAPCSATGTIRRHPDLAWLKRARDVATAAALQSRLLQSAAGMLAPGGRLVFATCSLQAEEGEAHLREAAALGLKLDPIRPDEMPGLPEAILPSGAVRTRPDYWAMRGGMDGFFIARFVKG